MAIELERLVARLDADYTRFEKALAKATGVADRETNAIKKKFDSVEVSMAAAGKRGATAFTNNFQVGNVAAQFQDIAVQLAGGQSPFLIALQQGTQLSSALGPGQGLSGALSTLGAGFMSLVSPVNLALLAIIGLGGSAIAYFANMGNSAAEVEAVLKKHGELISSLRERYGEAASGLKQYADESIAVLQYLAEENKKRLEATFQSLAAGATKTIETWANVGSGIAGLAPELRGIGAAIEELLAGARSGAPNITAFRDALAEIANTTADEEVRGVAKELLDVTATAGNAQRALDAASTAINRTGQAALSAQPQISAYGDAMRDLAGLAVQLTDQQRALDAYKKARDNALDARESIAALDQYKGALDRIKAAEDAKAAKRGGGGGSSAEKTSEYDREIAKIRERTGALAVEAATIGNSQFEIDRAKVAYELLEAAKKDTDKLSPQRLAEIEQASKAYAHQEEVLRSAHDAQRQMQEMQQFIGQSISGFFSDIVSGGRNAEEALMNLVKRLADVVLQAALLGDGPLGDLLGTGKGGLIGSLFSGFGIGAKAAGGPVSAGRPYVVGERGPEVMVPGSSGVIIPNAALARSSGPSVTIVQNIAAGVSYRDLAAAMGATRQAAMQGVQDALSRGRMG